MASVDVSCTIVHCHQVLHDRRTSVILWVFCQAHIDTITLQDAAIKQANMVFKKHHIVHFLLNILKNIRFIKHKIHCHFSVIQYNNNKPKISNSHSQILSMNQRHEQSSDVAEGATTKIVDIYVTWSSCWVEEWRARDGWCIVEIRWMTGFQGLIGKCSDFELYSVVNRKTVNS